MNGAVGGVAAIIVAVVVIFYLRRRRSRAPSTAASGLGAPQPAMDEIKQTSTEEEKNTGSSLPGTSPMSPKFYVRVFICNSPPLLLCSSHVLSSAFLFCFETRMIQLLFLRTKGLCNHPSSVKDLCRRTTPAPKAPGNRLLTV